MGSYVWSDSVPAYSSGAPAYWVRVINTYSNPSSTEYVIYKDQGLTDAVKTSHEANTTANNAKSRADDAWDKADNAEGVAQQASINVTNLQTRTKYFWTNLVAHTNGISGWTKPSYPVGTYAASGIDGTTFDYEDSSTYGYNTLYSNGIRLRYNAINLGELTGTSLVFYNPSTTSQGTKAMELSGSALKFYASNGSTVQAEFGGDLAKVSGQLIAQSGYIGTNESNRWFIGNRKNYDQTNSAALVSYGNAYIQLGEDGCWRLSTNRLHTGWNAASGSNVLHYPKWNNIYWDFGIHAPSQSANKFIYIRNYDSTDSGYTEAQILQDLQDNFESNVSVTDSWQYRFYITADGSLYARNLYVMDDNGNTTQIGGTDGVYLLKSGGTITGNLEVNGNLTKGGKKVAYLTPTTPTSGQVLVADGTSGGIKTSGYTIATSVPSGAIFTDQNVKTDLASNSTTFYIAGPTSTATTTGTLKVITDAKVTIDGSGKATITATTFSGNLSGTATKANQDGDGNVIKSTYLKLSGGNVTGAVSFGSSVSMDEATIGDLVVNGSVSFTNNLQANTINGVAVGSSPKFTDTVTTVTTSGNGNAVTAITASNGKLTVTKGSTFLTSYTETDPVFVASAAHGITSEDISNWNSKTSNTGTVTKVTAGTGLAIGTTAQGSFTTSGTINHTNSVTAKTAAAQSAKTLTFGGTFTLYEEKYDAQGHITGVASYNMTMPANPNTHYTANLITGTSATAKANAAASTNGNVYLNLIENDTVRNAHKIVGSGTTTVTSDADGVITISSADSKTGTVTSITLTQGTGISIGSSGTAITTSGTRTISLADNYGDTKNPYASKTARYVLAAPANAAGVPSFRALTNADVGLSNVLNATQITGIGQGENGTIRVYKGENTYEDVPVEIVATESSTVASAQKLSSYGGSNKQPVYFPSTGSNAGKPVAIGYTIETSVPSGAVFTDTTYTFTSGTNGFTVTPLNGTAQTVTVTPSITNNITGSGSNGYLAKFSNTNTLTNGPQIGTGTTKFLREDGTWVVPSGNVTGVKGNSESSYRTGQVNITKANIGLGNVDNTADANKNVLTATKFNSNRTIALTGDVTGSASGDGSSGWSISTTVGDDSHFHTMAYSHKPIQSKTYANTSYYATSSGSWEAASWYFMSVKPDTWDKPWKIRIRVHSFCPGYTNVESYTDALITGRRDGLAYSNYTERLDTAHYYIPYYTLKKAGFDAGLGHAIGVSILYGTGYTTAAYYRTFEVDFYESENCTVTFFDTPIKWSNWTNGNTTNYNNLGSLDAVTRGYTESGDRNDVNYQNRIYYTYKKPYATLYRYQILLSRANGTLLPVNSVDNAPSNINKTLTTEEFDPFGEIYYYNSSTTRTTSQNLDNNVLYRQILADLRYSFNITNESGKCLTSSQPVYIVATPQSNGMAKLASPALVQALPSTEDGKIYIYIGQAYPDTYPYRTELPLYHPIYWYKNGTIRQYFGDAATVNNHTVASDVPANAVFTDTWNALSTSQAGYVAKAPNSTSQFLRGDATWAAVTKANVGLGNVENTALSTWAGSSNITTVGTISTGTWSGSTIAVNKGGTGATTFTSGAALIGNGTGAIQTRSITNVTSGAVTANTNLVTANSLVAHVENKIAAAKDTYVTIGTDQTITASQKTFNGAIRWGTTSEYGAIHYDTTLDALVFSFA